MSMPNVRNIVATKAGQYTAGSLAVAGAGYLADQAYKYATKRALNAATNAAYRTLVGGKTQGSYAPNTRTTAHGGRGTRGHKPKKAMRMKGKPSLTQKVNRLAREVKQDISTLEYINLYSARTVSSVAQSNHADTTSWAVTMANYNTVLAQLRFFNPSVPGTLITASGASGTYRRDLTFKTVYNKLTVANNYQVPCQVDIYSVVPKGDTTIAPTTAFTNGLADIGNPSSSSTQVYLTDSDEFKRLWTIVEHTRVTLIPGQKTSCTYAVKDVRFDSSIAIDQTQTYQHFYKCQTFVVRVQGVLGHDSSANQQSILGAAVDIINKRKYVVEYDGGGPSLKTKYINDQTPQTFTNGGVVSNKPVSGQQAYSV